MKYKNWIFGKDGALLRAAATGKLDLIKELIQSGANLNVVSCNGYTPLHRAAQNGHANIVEFLLKEGAIVCAEANDGQTPLSLARQNGHDNIAALLSQPKNIVLIGFMGTGKTSAGKSLAQKLNMIFTDMDDIIQERAGKPISRIFAEDGEPHFRSMERNLVMELSARKGLVIATGGGIVLDKNNIADFSKTSLVVCLCADPEAILKRIAADTTRPLLAGDDKFKKILSILETRRPLYNAIPHRVDTTALTVEQVVDQIMAIRAKHI